MTTRNRKLSEIQAPAESETRHDELADLPFEKMLKQITESMLPPAMEERSGSAKPVAECTDDELRTELVQRQGEREAYENLVHQTRFSHLKSIPKRTLIVFVNIFCPTHDRASCSDENLANGWFSRDDETPRCARCAFLETIRDGYVPEKISVELVWRKRVG